MIVEYRTEMYIANRIIEAINKAKDDDKKIKYITLTPKEWDDFCSDDSVWFLIKNNNLPDTCCFNNVKIKKGTENDK